MKNLESLKKQIIDVLSSLDVLFDFADEILSELNRLIDSGEAIVSDGTLVRESDAYIRLNNLYQKVVSQRGVLFTQLLDLKTLYCKELQNEPQNVCNSIPS